MIQIDKFTVRIVNTGDKYGLNDCLVNSKAPMIEFYDSRYPLNEFMGRGQFIARYYAETLIDSGCRHGLCLDGGVPEWSVSAEGMAQVIEYIKGV